MLNPLVKSISPCPQNVFTNKKARGPWRWKQSSRKNKVKNFKCSTFSRVSGCKSHMKDCPEKNPLKPLDARRTYVHGQEGRKRWIKSKKYPQKMYNFCVFVWPQASFSMLTVLFFPPSRTHRGSKKGNFDMLLCWNNFIIYLFFLCPHVLPLCSAPFAIRYACHLPGD